MKKNFLKAKRNCLWDLAKSEKNRYQNFYGHRYFWRTTQQKEIDYLEDMDGSIKAFEFKWNEKSGVRFPSTFLNAYTISETKVIHTKNYEQWLL